MELLIDHDLTSENKESGCFLLFVNKVLRNRDRPSFSLWMINKSRTTHPGTVYSFTPYQFDYTHILVIVESEYKIVYTPDRAGPAILMISRWVCPLQNLPIPPPKQPNPTPQFVLSRKNVQLDHGSGHTSFVTRLRFIMFAS